MSEQTHHGPDDPAHPHNAPLSDVQLRVRALESLLVDKGLVDPAALDELVDFYRHRFLGRALCPPGNRHEPPGGGED